MKPALGCGPLPPAVGEGTLGPVGRDPAQTLPRTPGAVTPTKHRCDRTAIAMGVVFQVRWRKRFFGSCFFLGGTLLGRPAPSHI